MIRTINRKPASNARSVIAICEWFTTTYHNRSVKTPRELKAVKLLGEPFQIKLEKSGDSINWVDLK